MRRTTITTIHWTELDLEQARKSLAELEQVYRGRGMWATVAELAERDRRRLNDIVNRRNTTPGWKDMKPEEES